MEGLAKGEEDLRTGSQSAWVSSPVLLLWGLFTRAGGVLSASAQSFCANYRHKEIRSVDQDAEGRSRRQYIIPEELQMAGHEQINGCQSLTESERGSTQVRANCRSSSVCCILGEVVFKTKRSQDFNQPRLQPRL